MRLSKRFVIDTRESLAAWITLTLTDIMSHNIKLLQSSYIWFHMLISSLWPSDINRCSEGTKLLSEPMLTSSKVFCGIYMEEISQDMLMNLIHHVFRDDTFKITTSSRRVNNLSPKINTYSGPGFANFGFRTLYEMQGNYLTNKQLHEI